MFAEDVVTEILEPVPHRHVVLTIPRVLRGLFQRERRLLGVLAHSARDAIVPSVRAILDRKDVTPGLVVSIQTFGSYAANFHPHVHALLTDGACNKEGEFVALPDFYARLVEEVFRRRVLERLYRSERLSEEFLRFPPARSDAPPQARAPRSSTGTETGQGCAPIHLGGGSCRSRDGPEVGLRR